MYGRVHERIGCSVCNARAYHSIVLHCKHSMNIAQCVTMKCKLRLSCPPHLLGPGQVAAQHIMAQHSTAQQGTAWHGTAQHGTAWHSMVCTSLRVHCLLQAFKDGDIRFLICTDVAARGIDIAGLPFVINMTLPDRSEDYIHRVGRVGQPTSFIHPSVIKSSCSSVVWSLRGLLSSLTSLRHGRLMHAVSDAANTPVQKLSQQLLQKQNCQCRSCLGLWQLWQLVLTRSCNLGFLVPTGLGQA